MVSSRRHLPLTALVFAAQVGFASVGHAAEPVVNAKTRQVWQLLDYVAVDYGGAVANRAVLKASEYAEMQEFAAAAERQLSELPRGGATAILQKQVVQLRKAVADTANPTSVAQLAHGLAGEVLKAYLFPIAPAQVPDLCCSAQLLQAQCAACHGPQGHGDGPLAASLDPKPTALSEHLQACERSLFALHQVISTGVNGTAMASFGALPEEDGWALAFFVGTLPYAEADTSAGATLWQTSAKARDAMSDMDALTQTSEHALAERLDAGSAKSVTAYLRANPQALAANKGGTLIAKAKLAESVAAVRAGDRAMATKLALSAYLDGFEPVEPALATRDRPLFKKIEVGMVAYRAKLAGGSIEDVQPGDLRVCWSLVDEQAARKT